jgi:hypothetical protein
MTLGLLAAGVAVLVLVAAGVWLMGRAEAEPAARAAERAPDPAEEREAEESSVPRSGLLLDRKQDGPRRPAP